MIFDTDTSTLSLTPLENSEARIYVFAVYAYDSDSTDVGWLGNTTLTSQINVGTYNHYPYFESPLDRVEAMVGETVTYTLPSILDDDPNDLVELRISSISTTLKKYV